MKSLLVFIIAFLSVHLLQAQEATGIPRIFTNPSKKEASIKSLHMEVEVEGWLARVVYEVEVVNQSLRDMEGEFSIQLPEGATVSTYGIDVNQKIRPAVSVSKDRALNAYETIKARPRIIDPGIVEKQTGNIYRTRVYPFMPRSSRHIRVGYVVKLNADGKLSIPLQLTEPIEEFKCVVKGALNAPRYSGNERSAFEGKSVTNTDLVDRAPGTDWIWESENAMLLSGDLGIQSILPKDSDPLIRHEITDEGKSHFIVQGIAPEADGKEKLDNIWKTKPIRVLWDCSYSGRFRDHERELQELGKLWNELGNVQVVAQHLSYGGDGKSEKLSIKGGDASGLNDFLKSASYEAALDMRQVKAYDGVTILITDSAGLSPHLMPDLEGGLENYYVLSIPPMDHSHKAMGAIRINGSGDWVSRLKGHDHIVKVTGEGADRCDIWDDGARYIVTGMAEGPNPHILITDASNKDTNVRGHSMHPFVVEGEGESWSFSRTAWAQQRLEHLEMSASPQIIAQHAKAERLPSDFTSLIVLESFNDHLLFRIPPPEPDLLERYERRLKLDAPSMVAFGNSWNNKLSWHEKDFPWIDETLQKQVTMVEVWVESSRIAFPEEKRNAESLDKMEAWLKRAKVTLTPPDQDAGKQAFKEWQVMMNQELSALEEIRKVAKDPAEGEPIHVSVRGFVMKRGVYTADAPLDLKDVIIKAGGTAGDGSLANVLLYRDADRAGFNLLSRKYRKMPLRSGDMVVVEVPLWALDSGGSDDFDPFFASPEPVTDPGNADATFDPDQMLNPDSPEAQPVGAGGFAPFGDDPIALGSPPHKSPGEDNVIVSYTSGPVSERANKLSDEWLTRFKKGDYEDVLSSWIDEQAEQGFSVSGLLEISRLLHDVGEKDLMDKALSHLLEIYPNALEGARAMAFWLEDMGEKDKAVSILQKLQNDNIDDNSLTLIKHDISRILSTVSNHQMVALSCGTPSLNEATPITVALTDYFTKGGESLEGQIFNPKSEKLTSDLRIVMTSAGGSFDALLNEPPGARNADESGLYYDESPRIVEMQVRRVWPGTYTLRASTSSETPITLRVEMYRNYGTDKEQKTVSTHLLSNMHRELMGNLEYDFADLE